MVWVGYLRFLSCCLFVVLGRPPPPEERRLLVSVIVVEVAGGFLEEMIFEVFSPSSSSSSTTTISAFFFGPILEIGATLCLGLIAGVSSSSIVFYYTIARFFYDLAASLERASVFVVMV